MSKFEAATKQLQAVRGKLTQSLQYQMRLEHETSNLRATMKRTALKFKSLSNDDEQIDRRIMIKLLVTFFERWYCGGDTKEVIALVAKILRFNEAERRTCRVGSDAVHGQGGGGGLWGFATSWMSGGSA